MKIQILGVAIDQIDQTDALRKIGLWLKENNQRLIATVNPEFLVAGQKNSAFRDVLNHADLVLCDGVGLVWAARFLGRGRLERVTGVDLTKALLDSKIEGLKIYLLGGVKVAAEKVKNEYSSVVVGAEAGGKLHTGGWRLENNEEVISRINESGANLLLVGFGQIKQEMWLAENLKKLPQVKVAMGVGGTLDYLSGRVRRAPKIFRQWGLEWLFRLARQPWRLGRIYNATAVFSYLIIKEKFLKK